MKLAPQFLFGRILLASVALLAAGGCGEIPGPTAAFSPAAMQVDQAMAAQAGAPFRSESCLELAAALQGLPRGEAETLLRHWADSGKYENEVIILCRMLFVAQDGRPLPRPPNREIFNEVIWVKGFSSVSAFHGMYGLGATHGADWPDWPLALSDGVPFLVEANHIEVLTGPPGIALRPLSPVYLDYCLTAGGWTAHRYAPVDSNIRQQALELLLHSPVWPRALNPGEIAYLTAQIHDGVSLSDQPRYRE